MLAFRLIASSDLPLVQLSIACLVGWLWSKRSPALIPISVPESELNLPDEQPVLGR